MFFVYNVRYADVAVVLGLVLLPINPVLSTLGAGLDGSFFAYEAILVATPIRRWDLADQRSSTERFVGGLFEGIDSLVGLLIGVAVAASSGR